MSDAHTNAVSITTAKPPAYAFLSHPPPPKKRPTQALPSPPTIVTPPLRSRSNTYTTIATWASLVQPGSPAPCSPCRRPSLSGRRPSLSRGRRSSITSIRVPSASFLSFVDTPTSGKRTTPSESAKDFQPDLMALGYTSAFIHLPRAPVSATLPIQKNPFGNVSTPSRDNISPLSSIPAPQTKAPKRTRSFSVLKPIRGRGRSKSTAMPSPPPTKAKSNVAITKRKKAKYAHLRPVPLSNELALAQFMDGGNMETNIHRFNESQAKAAACSGKTMGVGDVYRDGKGGIWLDQDEEWEYVGLLGGDDDREETQWVEFGGNQSPTSNNAAFGIDLAGEGRRESISTQDSDLDPRFAMHPVDHQDDLAAFGSALAPIVLRKPNMSVLNIPSRPRRNTTHLSKSEFVLDSTLPSSRKQDRRRRPAPLTLTPPSPASRRPSNSPLDTNKVRKDFLDGSFEPEPVEPTGRSSTSTIQPRRRSSSTTVLQPTVSNSSSTSSSSSALRKAMAKKPSRLNMKGLFKSVKRDVK